MILIIDVSVSPSSEVSKNIFKGGGGRVLRPKL